MHSFFKIFYIIVSTASLWIAFTPPQLPPAKDEGAESTALEVLIRQHSSRFIIKVSYRICSPLLNYQIVDRASVFALRLLR